MPETWLALDIGGANLKSADGRGYASARPFALWRTPDRLAAALAELMADAPRCTSLAATMTGELADCFATKAEGVRSIVAATNEAAAGRPVSFYSTQGQLFSCDEAAAQPLLVAASNWHALAAFAARYVGSSPAMLIDIGSTTTDVIPLDKGKPAATGATDPERLLTGELVYAGIERTPVSAVVRTLPWRDRDCPVASELFATTADAYVVLGDIPEDPGSLDTADGRPRTRAAAHQRLARMVCADATMFSLEESRRAAVAIRAGQVALIAGAVGRVAERMAAPPETVILSGHGEFLAMSALSRVSWSRGRPRRVLSLNTVLGPHVSRCAPAHALAVLADEGSATRRPDSTAM
jgi:probable H4MPT-linked C1 transfer pathway protein